MRQTILFYTNNEWNDEIMKKSPKYKGPINSWNVSKIKNMTNMFPYGYTFNQPLDNWDVSNVENMTRMFQNCRSFNQPLDKWDVSNVKNMKGMFHECSLFNQPLDNWDVSNVNNMSLMFKNCKSFNQPLDNWDISNVISIGKMFFGCDKFSETLDSWTTKLGNGNVVQISHIFEGCDEFDKERFLRKLYRESFETEDELYKLFEYDYILFLIIRYNKYKNIEYFTICDAIYLYNNVIDYYINGLLRNDNEIKEKLNPKLLEFFTKIIHTIDNYFINDAHKSYKGMKVYRGEKQLCEGDTCRMGVVSSYSSSSTDSNVSLSFTNSKDCCWYMYELEEGIPFIDVDEIMNENIQSLNCGKKLQLLNTCESEIILPRGIILNKIREELYIKLMRKFIMSVSYDKNYIKNNPINFNDFYPKTT
jgi:surface protein